MGYESHWSGEIRITPPLTWQENRTGPGLREVSLRLDEEVVDTETGQVRTVSTTAVVPRESGAYNGYGIEDELQALIDAHPDHQFSGAIVARPVDPGGTLFRYTVTKSALTAQRVVREVPRIVWPDGTEVGE